MTRALVGSSKFSPGNMRPEALEALFVGADRRKLLEDALRRIEASARGGEKHFLLFVGARGIGKTHFLSLLHHRLTTSPSMEATRQRLVIAFLNEEEWGVASYLDLLVRVLTALRGHVASEAIDARVHSIRDIHARDPSRAVEAAERGLLELVGERTLLILCENLEDLFHGLGDEGQKRLRAFIQEQGVFAIVATTPALFRDVQSQDAPFHGFFAIRALHKIDFDGALELLRKKAELDGKADLAAFLLTSEGRARVRGIHHLAAGNHRVYVALSPFLDRRSLDDLVAPFLSMVDDLTPYYQERMRSLASPQQRKLVDILSHARRPMQVKDVAEAAFIAPQVAAKQLGDLAKVGLLRSERQGREAYYELAEPLMRISFEVKDNRTKYLGIFVELLRAWFSVHELHVQHRSLGEEGRDVDRIHLEAALEAARQDGRDPLLDALRAELDRCEEQGDRSGADALWLRILAQTTSEVDYSERVHSLLEQHRIAEAGAVLEEGAARFDGERMLVARVAYYMRQARYGEAADALSGQRSVLKKELEALRGGLLLLDARPLEALKIAEDRLASGRWELAFIEQKARALLAIDRPADAQRFLENVPAEIDPAHTLAPYLSEALQQQGRIEEALAALAPVLGVAGVHTTVYRRWIELHASTGKGDAALEILAHAARDGAFTPWEALRMRWSILDQTGRRSEVQAEFLQAEASAWSKAVALEWQVRFALRDNDWTTARRLVSELAECHEPSAQSSLWETGVDLLVEGFVEEAQRLFTTAGPFHPFRHALRAEAEAELGHLGEARRELPLAGGFGSIAEQLIQVAERGFEAAAGQHFTAWLEAATPGTLLTRLVVLEGLLRGPQALVRAVADIGARLDASGTDPRRLPVLLLGLVRRLAIRGWLAEPAWFGVSEGLNDALAGREDCRLALSVFAAIARFSATGDRRALLELPLEVRALVEPALSNSP